MKAPDEAGEAVCEHRRDELAKGAAKLLKRFLVCLEAAQSLAQSGLAGADFSEGNTVIRTSQAQVTASAR
jgi:hypothetical protein